MSEGLNRVTLLGNLGADPELRYTQSGQPVLNLRLATTESYLDSNRVRQERTEWHHVVIWGKRGEGLARVLSKGSRILVEGGLRTSSYDDREGVRRYRTEIFANNVIFAGGGARRGDEFGGPPPARRGPAPGGDDFGGPAGGYGGPPSGGYRGGGSSGGDYGHGGPPSGGYGGGAPSNDASYDEPPADDFGNDDDIPF